MESFLEVAFLSIIQGVTEFLPVSSSGHLVICKHLLGVETPGADLEIALHFGTLLSVLAYYRKTVFSLLLGLVRMEKDACARVLSLAVSTIPAVVVYFAAGSALEEIFEDPGRVRWVGAALAATGAVILSTRFMPRGAKRVGLAGGFAMGCAQAVALMPGVSRSGATLAAARAAGADPEDAAGFSFLMCAPLIAGAALLKFLEPAQTATGAGGPGAPEICAGIAISAVSGFFALALLVRIFKGRMFWIFGPYCIAAGLAVFFLL